MTRIPQKTREPLRAMRLPVATPVRTPAGPVQPALPAASVLAQLSANPLAVTSQRQATTPFTEAQAFRPQSATMSADRTPLQTGDRPSRPAPPQAPAARAPQAPSAAVSPPAGAQPPAQKTVPGATHADIARQAAPGRVSQGNSPTATAPASVTTRDAFPAPPAAVNQLPTNRQALQTPAGIARPHHPPPQPAPPSPAPPPAPSLPRGLPAQLATARQAAPASSDGYTAVSRHAYAPATRAQTQAVPSQRLLKSLAQLDQATTTLRRGLSGRADRLLSSLNTPEQMTHIDGLKKAVLNSGLFLEARLAGKSRESTLDLSRDFKAALLRLRADLSAQLPTARDARLTEVATQVERSLARLDLSQLATVASDREQRPAWALELPVRTPEGEAEVARLSIQREADEARTDSDAQRVWSAVLKLEPAGLGRVTAHISVIGEHVTVGFKLADPRVQEHFLARLDALRSRLGRRGLHATRLSAEKAAPANGEDGFPSFTDTQA